MSQYNKLADIYDYLMGSVDYQAWQDYIIELCRQFEVYPQSVVDLACGTGNTTIPFAQLGCKTYGVDLSHQMLLAAREKAVQAGVQVDFLEQNMCQLAVPEQVDLVTCYHDGINYITNSTDLQKLFGCVKSILKPGGLFIFDLVNVHKLSRADGETTFADDENMALIWQSWYHQQEELWEISLTGFIKRGELYEKFQETHREKAYRREEIETMVVESGLQVKGVYHSYTLAPPHQGTYRLFFVVGH